MKYIGTPKPARAKVSFTMLALGIVTLLIGIFLSGLIPVVHAFEERMLTPRLLFGIGYMCILIGIVWIITATCSFPSSKTVKPHSSAGGPDQIAYAENGEPIEVYYD
ncbi:MAG: hypothetical protein V4478_02860 [Patescibacteria group bacterium]